MIDRARTAGIHRIISIGCDFESSERAIALARRFPGVRATVGWHPNYVQDAPADIRPRLAQLAADPTVAAIGECGIDHFRLPSKQPGGTVADDEALCARQREMFRQQLEVAADLGLNVVIHQRAAYAETMEIFRPFASRVRGVFHCFVGTLAELGEIVALGSSVSYTGIATFKNGADIRTALAATPADRFFLETDSPYLAPVPHRGKRCEPAYVRDLAIEAARVREVPLEVLSAQTEANVASFFRAWT